MADFCMRFPGGLAKALTLSYDDGVMQDQKLIEIMVKHGLKGTFNLNSGVYAPEGTVYPVGTIHKRMTEKEVSALYTKNGMEVATHGYTHPNFTKIPKHLVTKELTDDRSKLESQFDCIVRGHAYPYGAFNKEVETVLENVGLVYARTVNSTHNFNIPGNWLELNPTCHHDDPMLFSLLDTFNGKNDDWGHPMMFYLWGHAYEFDEKNNWTRIEEFARIAGGRSDVWYATNIEIYDYVKAYEKLVVDINISKVYNPTGFSLWFSYKNKTYEVKPLEIISI